MTQLPSLEELDVDGAIGEAAEHVDGKTRADFLRKAGLGAGAIVGGSALLGVAPSSRRPASPRATSRSSTSR